jgi:hypothetical protein
MKSLLIGCTSALVGLVIGIGLAFVAWTLLARAESSAPTTPVVGTARGDVTISVSAKYLNTQLQQLVKQTGLAQQATLTLVAPNIAQISATIETRILGQAISGSAVARVRVTVQNSRVVLTVEKVDVSGVGISQSFITPIVEQARVQIEDQINKMIQRELQGTGLRLSNIRIAPNEIAIDLTMP